MALVAGVSLGLSWLRPASAQEAEAAVHLLAQPPFHLPGDRLNASLRIVNTGEVPLENYQVRLSTFSAIEGRLELHDSFDGVIEPETFVRLGPEIPSLAPGESTKVTLDDRIEALGVPADGVYPVALSIVDETASTELGSITTHIVHYASRPRDPLNFVVLLPLTAHALKKPTGGFATGVDDRPVVADVLDPESGWLAGMLAAIEEAAVKRGRTRFAAGLAPSPRLVEELADAAASFDFEGVDSAAVRDQAKQALADFTSLLTSNRIQPLLAPYAFVDLPTIAARFDQENLNRQLSEANIVLEESLPDVTFDPEWFFAPGLRWDTASLADVRIAGADIADRTFFTRHAVSPDLNLDVGCPDVNEMGLAFACPVEIVPEGRPIRGYVSDPGIQERLVALTRPGNNRIELQRFFAETAMIHLEQPGTPGRVVAISVPSQLHPPPYLAGRLFGGLARAPWLKLLTPRRGLAAGPAPEDRELVTEAPPLSATPDEDYFAAIESASDAVEHYEEIDPPAGRLRRLNRNLLVAQSRLWWSDERAFEGMEFATETEEEIEAEFDKITIKGLDTTLTSQSAPVEFTVFNDAAYPVTIDIDLASPDGDIELDEADLDALEDVTIASQDNQQITVDAQARSSGIFQLTATVQTPRTESGVNDKTITIRSTNFNRIALGLTLGALAFLVLFYAWRWIRRHRGGAPTSQQARG